jgi:hypothetical protein
MLSSSPFFRRILGRKLKPIKTLVLGPDTFRDEFISYSKRHVNARTGKRYTEAEAKAVEPSIQGFVSDETGTLILARERGGPDTAVHEAMHKFENPRWDVPWVVNEGVTEFFSRKLCHEHGVPVAGSYEPQFRSVKKLVDEVVGETVLANAYFNGYIETLIGAVEVVTAAKRGLKGASKGTQEFPFLGSGGGMIGATLGAVSGIGTWSSWVAQMKAARFREADALL